MHNLEQLIAEWRKSILTGPNPTIRPEVLDELENHLRENVEQLLQTGLTETEAFQRAAATLGAAPAIATEFHKLEQRLWWPIKLAIGMAAIALISHALRSTVAFAFDGRLTSLLLAAHVFTVGLGYTITFIIGALGICFVGQRCFSELVPSRLRSLIDATFIFGCVAAGLTIAGFIFAMFWAKAEWGRYWGWDIREMGGLAVILWQLLFLLMHRFGRSHARGILITSLLGDIVVGLAWFGSNMLSAGPQGYGAWSYLLLLITLGLNLAFFLVGMAPAGWLRLHKAS